MDRRRRTVREPICPDQDLAATTSGEELTPEEAMIVYEGKEGKSCAADHGIVVDLDTQVTDALKAEGFARELIHVIQNKRKEAGLEFTDTITLSLSGAEDVLETHKVLVMEETRAVEGENKGKPEQVEVDGRSITLKFEKKST